MNIISLAKGLGAHPENQSFFFTPPLRQMAMGTQQIL
jgi:hypothetical protein